MGAAGAAFGSLEGPGAFPSLRRAAIASSSLRRCPNDATPSSFRSSAVSLRRTVSSISFSRKIASYFPRPRLRSQTTMSMTAPQTQGWRTSSNGPGRVSTGSQRRDRLIQKLDGRLGASKAPSAHSIASTPSSTISQPRASIILRLVVGSWVTANSHTHAERTLNSASYCGHRKPKEWPSAHRLRHWPRESA